MSGTRSIAIATGTLTIIRVPVAGDITQSDLAASTAVYPLVGVAIGVVPGLVLLGPGPIAIRAVIALVAWVVVTGALHLDGWADCCDAALAPDRVGRTAADQSAWRQGILKDPHVGVFGVVGIVLLLLVKGTALTSVPVFAPMIAAAVARYVMVLVIGRFRAARATGLVAAFGGKSAIGWATVMIAGIVVVISAVCGQVISTVIGALIGIIGSLLLAKFLAGKFGGVTGDVCGAVAEFAEVGVLLVFVALEA